MYSSHLLLFFFLYDFMSSLPQILSILGFHSKPHSLKYDPDLTAEKQKRLLHYISFKIWCLFAITVTESWGTSNTEQLVLKVDSFWTPQRCFKRYRGMTRISLFPQQHIFGLRRKIFFNLHVDSFLPNWHFHHLEAADTCSDMIIACVKARWLYLFKHLTMNISVIYRLTKCIPRNLWSETFHYYHSVEIQHCLLVL